MVVVYQNPKKYIGLENKWVGWIINTKKIKNKHIIPTSIAWSIRQGKVMLKLSMDSELNVHLPCPHLTA